MKQIFCAIPMMIALSAISCENSNRKAEMSNTQTLKFDSLSYTSDDLVVQTVAENTYLYTCFLETQSFGKVDCNGVVYVDDGEAMILDAPTEDAVSMKLIQLIESRLNVKVKAVVVNHFHEDCIGGLKTFHDLKIPSYSNNMTQSILRNKKKNEDYIPQFTFESLDTIQVGSQIVINAYLGKGHTADNIVTYIPATKVLFGGCLVKANNASKGNLEDADTLTWSSTINKVKLMFPEAQIIIPGHGKYGDSQLLDYTEMLFRP